MTFTLDHVVPWGRSFDEYRRMFALTDDDLRRRIVGCGDGPASFNAEAARRGVRVVSCDPIYRWDAGQIQARIAATCDTILEQTRANAHEFVWTTIGSIDDLDRVRMAAMSDFLSDFAAGKAQGRYLDAELPTLPFADDAFDLALSSHFLFLYTTQLGEDFHRAAVREMCRVAREVRIFPLLALGGRPSPLVDRVAGDCADAGCQASIETVPYEFQRGGNQMLRIRKHVRLAARGDVAAVAALARACVAEMRRRGIEQWDEVYPTAETFVADQAAGALYVAADAGGALDGAFTIDTRQPPEYAAVPWTIIAERTAVVHRLMVDPRQQGRGLARHLMQVAERRAAGLGFTAIRLDAYTRNPAALRLYRGLGYHDAGSVMLRKGEFRCFEKALGVLPS